MDTTTRILLVPVEGDPHGLLAGGLCSAQPPGAWVLHGHWLPIVDRRTAPQALVLAWDGKPVPEGIDRLIRVWSGLKPFQVAGGWKAAAPLVYGLLYAAPGHGDYEWHFCRILYKWGMLATDTEDRLLNATPPQGDLTIPWLFGLTSECLGLGKLGTQGEP